MNKLGADIKIGDRIKLPEGWREVLKVTADGVVTKDRLIRYGCKISGLRSTPVRRGTKTRQQHGLHLSTVLTSENNCG